MSSKLVRADMAMDSFMCLLLCLNHLFKIRVNQVDATPFFFWRKVLL